MAVKRLFISSRFWIISNLSGFFSVERRGHLKLVVYSTVPLWRSHPHPLFLPLRFQMFVFPGKKSTVRFAVGSIVWKFNEILRQFSVLPNLLKLYSLWVRRLTRSSKLIVLRTQPNAKVVVEISVWRLRSLSVRFKYGGLDSVLTNFYGSTIDSLTCQKVVPECW